MKKIIYVIAGLFALPIWAQTITMNFSHFKGNTYDFIIFQGTESVTVSKNAVIPENGTFILSVPEQYKPYTGMARWVITNTPEGGGLEVVIPGYDFSISCTEAVPNLDNIVFENNTQLLEINNFYQKQQGIFAKHDAMLQATQAFNVSDANYAVFQNEYQNQLKAYELFQQELKTKNNYAAQYINFINLLQGLGTKIYTDEKQKAANIAEYVVNDLNWNALYTSGHWSGVISSWISIYTDLFNDQQQFAVAFNTIGNKLATTQQYTDFVKLTANHLSRYGKDDFIKAITPIVTNSGRIEVYDGALAVFVSAKENEIAPSLVFSDENKVVQSKDFTNGSYEKTLVVFYQSECGNCNDLMSELKENYKFFTDKKVRVISISSDADLDTFNQYASSFPWKDMIYDVNVQNANFKNYGVLGTPTVFLLDKEGKIELRGATLDEVKQKM